MSQKSDGFPLGQELDLIIKYLRVDAFLFGGGRHTEYSGILFTLSHLCIGGKAGMRHTKVLAVFELLDVAIMGFYSEFSKFPT